MLLSCNYCQEKTGKTQHILLNQLLLEACTLVIKDTWILLVYG